MSFTKNLLYLQEKKHITNYRLAKEVGVHATTVKNWRDGKSPHIEHAAKIAAYFNTTVDELMK